jgi:hypothetical protein
LGSRRPMTSLFASTWRELDNVSPSRKVTRNNEEPLPAAERQGEERLCSPEAPRDRAIEVQEAPQIVGCLSASSPVIC